jgi:hypothetical protein
LDFGFWILDFGFWILDWVGEVENHLSTPATADCLASFFPSQLHPIWLLKLAVIDSSYGILASFLFVSSARIAARRFVKGDRTNNG